MLLKKKTFIFIFFVSVFSVIFANIFKDPFFLGDDFTMLSFKEVNFLKNFIIVDNWWRPFKNIFYSYFNVNYFFNAKYILIFKYIIHLIITFLVYFFFKKNFNKYSVIFSLVFFIHQTSVMAIYGIDTAGQQFMSLFGITSFIFLYYYTISYNTFLIIFSSFFLFLAFLSKENGVAFLFINFFFLLSFSRLNFFNKFSFVLSNKKIYFYCLLFIFIFLFYLFLRTYLGAQWSPKFDSGRYGINLIFFFKNIFLYFFSIFNPVDNSIIYLSIKNKFYSNIVFIPVLFFFIYFAYLLLSNFKNSIFNFLIFLVSCGPVIILNHISELYTYHSVFFFCLWLITVFNSFKFNYYSLKILPIYLFLIISFSSTVSKIYNINKNSILAKNLHDYILSQKSEKIFFDEIRSDKNKYSIYYYNNLENLLPRFYFRNFHQMDIYPLPHYIYMFNTTNNIRVVRELKFDNDQSFSLENFLELYSQKHCYNFFKKNISIKKICNF